MLAGKLDRKIDILRASITRNELNEDVEVWRAVVSRRSAQASPLSDGERFRAGETLAHTKMRFVIRYSSDVAAVDPRDRVLYNGRVFDINGVKELGRREGLEITATARAETP